MPTRRFIRIAVWVAVVVPAMVAGAFAQPTGQPPSGEGTVAVLALIGSGDTNKETLARAEESVLRALTEAGLAGVRNERVRVVLREAPDLVGCVSKSCIQKLGAAVGVPRFVTVSLDAQGLSFTIRLKLYAVGRDGPAKDVELPCDVCSVIDLDKAMRRAVAELLAPPPPMAVEITSEPPGASMTVDGEAVGAAPYTGRLTPGSHEVAAELPGYLPSTLGIEVAEQAEGAQRFHLALIEMRVERPSRPFKLLKWGGAGVTVGALAMGLTWVVVDGDGTCSDQPTCPQVYNTRTPGVIALGAGTAVGAFTAWMFMRDRKDADKAASLAVSPTAGGALARVGWSF